MTIWSPASWLVDLQLVSMHWMAGDNRNGVKHAWWNMQKNLVPSPRLSPAKHWTPGRSILLFSFHWRTRSNCCNGTFWIFWSTMLWLCTEHALMWLPSSFQIAMCGINHVGLSKSYLKNYFEPKQEDNAYMATKS
jgi:hypothetical protein